ncbi:MAG: HD domain-containing protein [Thermodesulfobacteriota bacterium]|nr:HD domain-containing protein [Thermodesulfobacteriota bacterium]
MANELILLKERLNARERQHLSSYATFSAEAVRRQPEERLLHGHRQEFSVDADRILHSQAYTRYIDKTQVFSLIKNDHITHRVLHVQLVSKVGRTIGRYLGLNEDLIEAIALGHDIGHPPFGHDGEGYLSEICVRHGIGAFQHNIQSVRFLEKIERKGCGWNLSLQVLDGILCHDGEVHNARLAPQKKKTFSALEQEMETKKKNPRTELIPMTMEGCVVRMADTISYIGRDVEDAIRLNLIRREDIPERCKKRLGDTNGSIVYNLVEDILLSSMGKNFVAFSPEVADTLKEMKDFNIERIYRNPAIKTQAAKIKRLYDDLFAKYLKDILDNNQESGIFKDFLEGMIPSYQEETEPAEVARDFIAGMTDEYFLEQGQIAFMPHPLPRKF